MKNENSKKVMRFAGAMSAIFLALGFLEKRILEELFARDDKVMGEAREGKLYEYEWFETQTAQDLYITAKDEIELHAHYFPQDKKEHRYMILQHGFHGYVKELSYEAKHFYELGYHLLMPSMRAHGLSGGALITMGLLEHRDTCDWIAYIHEFDPLAEIYIYGVSMGAATTLLALADKEASCVKAAISDCAYTTAIDVFDEALKKSTKLPYRWYINASNDILESRTNISIQESRPIDIVDNIATPVLFIHGDEDDLVPCRMVYELYDRATCEKELLIIKHAKHALASSVDPKTYWKHVDQFLDKYQSKTM